MNTRGGGISGRFVGVAKSLGALGKDHVREEEAVFRDSFLKGALEKGAILNDSFLRVDRNSFLSKLIIYKDGDQQELDLPTNPFAKGATTTALGSVKPIRAELSRGNFLKHKHVIAS